jgi:hypothetical protein
VVALDVFTAAIGMLLATPDLVPWRILLCGLTGIWLVAALGPREPEVSRTKKSRATRDDERFR